MKVAIYPGTFDPVTNGHIDVLKRAAGLFDEIIMAVALDSNKNTLFTVEERVALLEEAVEGIPGVRVTQFSGMTVDLARKHGAIAIIRGLRLMGDFEYEFQLALMNKKLAPDIETVFLMTNSEYSFISSTAIKWSVSLKGSISEFVPAHVERALIEKYAILHDDQREQ